MAVTLINSTHSFVRFSSETDTYCGFGDVNYCLPVYEATDVNFQFIATGTEAEMDDLCRPGAAEVSVGLVSECADEVALLTLSEKPQRFRLSTTQILYNWENGFTGFPGDIAINQCFKIRVTLLTGAYDVENTYCSNCFERISDPCFTSVLEYGNDEDAFGFKYCYAGGVDEPVVSCEPTIISFVNKETLAIPYTAMLQAQYGSVPNVQTWIYDENGVLTNMNIQVTFNAYPPTVLNWDFGGPASGIIILR